VKPQRPYLLRALYQWLVDSGETPYVLVDATAPGTQVPAAHVEDGQIVLNIGPGAVRDLVLGDEFVMCGSRFEGRHFDLVLPVPAIKAIYGKESNAGMVFPEEVSNPVPDRNADPDRAQTPGTNKKPDLKLV